MEWDYWNCAIVIYAATAICSLIPTLSAILTMVKLNPDGSGYEQSKHFNEFEIDRLKQHYSRIVGTLTYWKNRAEKYRRFKNYCIAWSISISILIPVMSQSIGQGSSNWFLTIVSTHGALTLAFYRAFKVEKNYQAFRLAESEFYDLRRELLDNPETFGITPKEQIDDFFNKVRVIRSSARQSEVDNTASVESSKGQG